MGFVAILLLALGLYVAVKILDLKEKTANLSNLRPDPSMDGNDDNPSERIEASPLLPREAPWSTSHQRPSSQIPETFTAKIDRLALAYAPDELFVSSIDLSTVGICFDEQKVILCTRSSEKLYDFSQIVSVEVVSNGISLSQTNRGSQLLGAAVGGAVFGGMGALAGSLTGSTRSRQRLGELTLKIGIRDRDFPIFPILFLAKKGKGIEASSAEGRAAIGAIERVHAHLINAMKTEGVTAAGDGVLDTDRLQKLWDMKQSGALTELEFDEQKRRLLSNDGHPVRTPSQDHPPQFYAVAVLDWGRNSIRERAQIIATLGEFKAYLKDPVKPLTQPTPYIFATGVAREEAARIKARLSAVGCVVQTAVDATNQAKG